VDVIPLITAIAGGATTVGNVFLFWGNSRSIDKLTNTLGIAIEGMNANTQSLDTRFGQVLELLKQLVDSQRKG